MELLDEEHRWIRFSTYQQRDYYMGLKTIPQGTVIRLRFERVGRKSRSHLASWEAIGAIPDEERFARFDPLGLDATCAEEALGAKTPDEGEQSAL